MAHDAPDWRVLLRDRASTASVVANGVAHDGVPIVTATAEEADDSVLAAVTHDAVLLKEQSDGATVRLGDALRANVPIFKERLLDEESGAAEMIRVRVHAIRDRAAALPLHHEPRGGAEEKRVFARFLKSKKA